MSAIGSSQLVGIAKLATEGQVLNRKRRVEYRTLPTRKWLNRCQSQRVPFDWTINPYRGCEFGCKYCYARYTHEFMERRDSDAFETEIYAKEFNRTSFSEELSHLGRGESIAVGTATDPYQPLERKCELTRRVLEELCRIHGHRVYLTTKSDLVERDVDLWVRIARANQVSITMTVTTTDRVLARLLEPYAPRPDLRLGVVKNLAAAGLAVSVMASPVLPLITDSEGSLDEIARRAKEAGATMFGGHVLFLKPCSARVFFPFLEEQFPHLAARYRANYELDGYVHGAYVQRVRKLFASIRQRHGLTGRDFYEAESDQLKLF